MVRKVYYHYFIQDGFVHLTEKQSKIYKSHEAFRCSYIEMIGWEHIYRVEVGIIGFVLLLGGILLFAFMNEPYLISPLPMTFFITGIFLVLIGIGLIVFTIFFPIRGCFFTCGNQEISLPKFTEDQFLAFINEVRNESAIWESKKTCQYCHAENTPDRQICKICGKPLT